jgi:transposase InsO family protein
MDRQSALHFGVGLGAFSVILMGLATNVIAAALLALARDDFRTACAEYGRILQTDSADVLAWYGIGECLSLDSAVVRSRGSPSGWAFRSSFHRAAEAYARAVEIEPDVRELIRKMCRSNPLWGAPRIHGELLKLGTEISETTVAKYMLRRRGPPTQTWRTFLKNHADELIALDFFTMPTATFKVLFVLIVLSHDRRRVLHFNVTEDPTAVWTARQLLEACGTEETPRYLIRDRDTIYGEAFNRQAAALGIEQAPTAPRSPWQNPYAERVIGSIRRECLDHVVVLGPRHLRRILSSYVTYYNGTRNASLPPE